ncbi:hypothetical protein G8S49_11175 [Clostridium botulinum C]|uniref:Uncharacterized protein n=2 Tax=Clostridium botulinum TaxID=1491 RepID=A0A9Q4XWC6_CLOBO|nr:hypothetical protein [Clostridium botulinum]EGO86247.1 hypothetical protein CBCST_22670 [Clostridium botulinum C str. Stockholm]MCD3195714.1 hypothetical protein [Clostridium botulinum C]MCD3201130.1 hypothetical protein [Clostridium botulinum C]MCD3206618.1 hypothetical protein [Clostridium botulinum C]MCD3209383.1 hypothetical protein [Clostridium botulinum C]
MKNLEIRLKDYKRKKSIVETIDARIEAYKYALSNPDERYNEYCISSRELGMPSAHNANASSSVEATVVSKEKMDELLQEWIREDRSRKFPLQLEVKQIDAALKALTSQERTVIELKYFEKMFWRDIEINFNLKFNTNITDIRLKQINKDALRIMYDILYKNCQCIA